MHLLSDSGSKLMCFMCSESVASVKIGNMKLQYKTNYNHFEGSYS